MKKCIKFLKNQDLMNYMGKENICPNINVALEKAKGIIEE